MRSTRMCYDTQTRDSVAFGLYLSQQHNEEPLFNKQIHIDATFYMPINKALKDRKESYHHGDKPYLDNLYKFLVESMRNVVIPDERVICSLSLKKVYDKEPRTEFTITEVD